MKYMSTMEKLLQYVLLKIFNNRGVQLGAEDGTGMRRITKFQSTTARIYDGGPIL